ncbi:MAG: porin family protein [Ramlibacter sp.]
MKYIAIAAAASALLMAGAAQAQTKPGTGAYGELGYTFVKISEPGLSVKPGMLRGVIGFNLSENLAVEALGGVGIRKDNSTVDAGGVPVNLELDVRHVIGAYIKPQANIGDAVQVFGRLGYAETRLRATASAAGLAATGSGSESSFSYGLGANFNVSPKMYVSADYMRYTKKDDTKVDGLTVGVGYRF